MQHMNRQGPAFHTFTDVAVKKSATIAVGGINSLVLQTVQALYWRMLPGLAGLFTVGALYHHGISTDPVRGQLCAGKVRSQGWDEILTISGETW